MPKVLFVCTGNACRSQMAEAWLRELGGPSFEADSAGIEAHGLNPRAVAVMAEVEIDISGQKSTRLTGRQLQWADIVVTVCAHADERCPLLPPGTRKEHWPLDDPAGAEGSEDEVLAVFRSIRDDIRLRILALRGRDGNPPQAGEAP